MKIENANVPCSDAHPLIVLVGSASVVVHVAAAAAVVCPRLHCRGFCCPKLWLVYTIKIKGMRAYLVQSEMVR